MYRGRFDVDLAQASLKLEVQWLSFHAPLSFRRISFADTARPANPWIDLSDGRSQITQRPRRVSQPRSVAMDEGTPQASATMKVSNRGPS